VQAVETARSIVANLDLVALDDALLDAAAAIEAADLRSLDAIHVAAARQLGQELECLLTYDRRMAVAGAALGMTVIGPS
jgi:predicted nucleic acid-binding protein